MTGFLALLTKFGPAVAPVLYLGYVVASGQTSLILPSLVAVFAALGVSVKLNTAGSAAQAAADSVERVGTSTAQLHVKLNALMSARPGMPGGDRPL